MVGTPGADLEAELDMTREEVGAALSLDVSRPVLLVLQHPASTEAGLAASQMRETMEAVCSFGEQIVVIFPNADAGGRGMIDVIKNYEGLPNVRAHKSLPRSLYVGLLSVTTVMIGNSSSDANNCCKTFQYSRPATLAPNISTRVEVDASHPAYQKSPIL